MHMAILTLKRLRARPVWRALVSSALVLGLAVTPVGADDFDPTEEPTEGRLPAELAMTPRVDGDQLFFFFDARTSRVPFLGVSNVNPRAMVLDVQFLDTSLARLAAFEMTLPASGQVLIDASTIQGVTGHLGLVMITPCDPATLRPLVPEVPLLGGFTLANTALGSGFGQNPFGRLAIDRTTGRRASGGTIIGDSATGGTNVAYQQIEPTALVLPFYFDPANLSPPEFDGNRLFLAAFCDVYSAPPGGLFFSLRPAPGFAFDSVTFVAASGGLITAKSDVPAVGGVLSTTIQELAAPAVLTGGGKVVFELPATDSGCRRNVFGLASQSLGTFAVGQRLPGLPAHNTLP